MPQLLATNEIARSRIPEIPKAAGGYGSHLVRQPNKISDFPPKSQIARYREPDETPASTKSSTITGKWTSRD